MLDHVIISVSDFKRSTAFYTEAFKPLGITVTMDYKGEGGHPDFKGFGHEFGAFFWLKDGKADSRAVHIGLVAKDHAEVDAFYRAAVAASAHLFHSQKIKRILFQNSPLISQNLIPIKSGF